MNLQDLIHSMPQGGQRAITHIKDLPSPNLRARFGQKAGTLDIGYSVEGKQQYFKIGSIPRVGATEDHINKIFSEYKLQYDRIFLQGIDPAKIKRSKKEEKKKREFEQNNLMTFEDMLYHYIPKAWKKGDPKPSHRSHVSDRQMKEDEGIIRLHLTQRKVNGKVLTHRPVHEIQVWEFKKLLYGDQERGVEAMTHDNARKAKSLLSQAFRHLINDEKNALGLVKYDPIPMVKEDNSRQTKRRKRFLNDNELRDVWTVLDSDEWKSYWNKTGADWQKGSDAIKLCFYLATRQDSIPKIRPEMIYDEPNGQPDTNGSWIKFGAGTTKGSKISKDVNRHDHWIFLTPQAKEILHRQNFTFFEVNWNSTVFKRAVKMAGIKEGRPEFLANGEFNPQFNPKTDPVPTGHAIRRTTGTLIAKRYGNDMRRLLSDQKFNEDGIKSTRDNLDEIYDGNTYAEERQEGFTYLADRIDQIVGLKSAKVLPIKKSA